jgi:hypothetical protein
LAQQRVPRFGVVLVIVLPRSFMHGLRSRTVNSLQAAFTVCPSNTFGNRFGAILPKREHLIAANRDRS